jgi:hypothetical protein
MGLTRVAGLFVLAAAWPCGVSAQSAVRSVTLFADLNTDDGSAIVRVEIDFATFDTADLRIELLGFGNTRTEGFLAGGEDGPLVRFEDRSGRREWIVVGRDGFEQIGIQRIAETDTVWRFSATYVAHNTGRLAVRHQPACANRWRLATRRSPAARCARWRDPARVRRRWLAPPARGRVGR